MKLSLFIAITLFTVTISGQAAELPLESCAAMEDPAERLACYDALAGHVSADTTKAGETAPDAVDPEASGVDVIDSAVPAVKPAVTAVEPAPDAEAVFGFERKKKSEEEHPDTLQIKWTRKEKDGFGKWIITMENGQVWRQTDSRRFSFVNPEQWVVISRGLLGSFFLGEPERNGSIRVKRIK